MTKTFLAGSALAFAACFWLQGATAQEKSEKGGRDETQAGGGAKLSDQQFVKKASADGLAEVNLGRLAAERASNPDVKKYGAKLVQDHTKANMQLLQIANKHGWAAAQTMDEKHQKMFDKLSAQEGKHFDEHYLHHMLQDHKTDIAQFEQEAKNAQDQELRSWVNDQLPILREHLRMAQQLSGHEKGENRTQER